VAKKVRRTIRVTARERDAAQSLLKLDRVLGRPSDPSVELIANAKPVLLGGYLRPTSKLTLRKIPQDS
jgi:hypothetical protein